MERKLMKKCRKIALARNLDLQKGSDGYWLSFKTDHGKEEVFHIINTVGNYAAKWAEDFVVWYDGGKPRINKYRRLKTAEHTIYSTLQNTVPESVTDEVFEEMYEEIKNELLSLYNDLI